LGSAARRTIGQRLRVIRVGGPGVLSRLRRFARFVEAFRLAVTLLRVVSGEYRHF
jgi:hypothetical protein